VFVWEGGELSGPQEVEVVGGATETARPALAAARDEAKPERRVASRSTLGLTAGIAVVLLVLTVLAALVACNVCSGYVMDSARGRLKAEASLRDAQARIAELEAKLQGASSPTNAPGETGMAPTPSAPAAPARTYVVKHGDSLWAIARHYYGDGDKWPLVAEANHLKPEDLEPGMKLMVPEAKP
jgi:LysM repeat protein